MKKTIYSKKNAYNDISVIQDGDIRKLVFGEGACREQSAINVKDLNENIFDYVKLSLDSLRFVECPKKILVVGLGGGVVPLAFYRRFPDAKIDVIEIDKDVLKVAKKFFYFKENKSIKVHIGDAFNLIDKMHDKYDIILMDAFSTDYIPLRLMTVEFIGKLKNMLNDNGVVCFNVSFYHRSFFSHLNAIFNVFGDNIYEERGSRNFFACMLFVSKKEDVNFKRIFISEKILNAKPFRIGG